MTETGKIEFLRGDCCSMRGCRMQMDVLFAERAQLILHLLMMSLQQLCSNATNSNASD